MALIPHGRQMACLHIWSRIFGHSALRCLMLHGPEHDDSALWRGTYGYLMRVGVVDRRPGNWPLNYKSYRIEQSEF